MMVRKKVLYGQTKAEKADHSPNKVVLRPGQDGKIPKRKSKEIQFAPYSKSLPFKYLEKHFLNHCIL
jgi:hypothetical protein